MVLIGMILYAYCKEQLRFRPLAGIMVLIVIADLLALSLTEGRFRPLAGIMVLIELQAFSIMRLSGLKSFRPLAGIMVLIIIASRYDNGLRHVVSVPLRGLWFLSLACPRNSATIVGTVSVPLRGLWFLSHKIHIVFIIG